MKLLGTETLEVPTLQDELENRLYRLQEEQAASLTEARRRLGAGGAFVIGTKETTASTTAAMPQSMDPCQRIK